MSVKAICEKLGYSVLKEFNGINAELFSRFVVKNNEVYCLGDNKNTLIWLQSTGQI